MCTHTNEGYRKIHFQEGNAVPIQTQADYLGGRFKNSGDHKPELQNRIAATWSTLRKLDLLWGKSAANVKLKIKVYDAVFFVAKPMYGLASIPITKADGRKLDAFQMKGPRKISKGRNPYWSRVSNEKLLEIINAKLKRELEDKELRRLSTRLIERQIALYAHIIRLEQDDPMKRISITEQGERVRADFRRSGRPRITWYDTTGGHIITKLRQEGIINESVAKHEINDYIVKYALDREM